MIVSSERLQLREVDAGDVEFIMMLYNQPDFIRFVGNKQLSDHTATLNYIDIFFRQSYQNYNYGLYLVSTEAQVSLGICGLIQRTNTSIPELGFGFAREHWSKGYAYEASQICLSYAQKELAIHRVHAVCNAKNKKSMQLLLKLGFNLKEPHVVPDSSELHFLLEKKLL